MFVDDLSSRASRSFTTTVTIKETRAALRRPRPPASRRTSPAATRSTTSEGGSGGPSVLARGAIGAFGALIILLFVFGTLPAVAMPLAIAIASILNTFTLIWLLTYITDVSLIVQFLVALVGLGVAIDYSLLDDLPLPRRAAPTGETPEEALVETMTHAGRSVIVSGSTVAIGLLSIVILPDPVHPLDRDRRHAHPGGVRARGDHAAAGAALACSGTGSTASA